MKSSHLTNTLRSPLFPRCCSFYWKNRTFIRIFVIRRKAKIRNINFFFFFSFKEHDVRSIGRKTCTHGFFFERMFDECLRQVRVEIKNSENSLLATREPTAKLHGNPNYSETRGPTTTFLVHFPFSTSTGRASSSFPPFNPESSSRLITPVRSILDRFLPSIAFERNFPSLNPKRFFLPNETITHSLLEEEPLLAQGNDVCLAVNRAQRLPAARRIVYPKARERNRSRVLRWGGFLL